MKKKIIKTAPKKALTKKTIKVVPVRNKNHAAKKIVKNTKTSSVKNLTSGKPAKRTPISIRMLTTDIEAIKVKAAKIGVPYQTYINIIIHRDVAS